jgi:hypothetical protein
MRRLVAALTFIVALALPASAQHAPVTPGILDMDKTTVVHTWGMPSYEKWDWHEEIGKFRAYRYNQLPAPPFDPPGTRSLTVMIQNGEVVGAVEITELEDRTRSIQRIQNRIQHTQQVWGPTEKRGATWAYWLRGDQAYDIFLFGNGSNYTIPEDEAMAMVVLGEPGAFSVLQANVPYKHQ